MARIASRRNRVALLALPVALVLALPPSVGLAQEGAAAPLERPPLERPQASTAARDTLCEAALGLGLTLFGYCEAPPPPQTLPDMDPGVLGYDRAPPPEPDPIPAPNMGPVIVEKTTIVERVVETPPPPQTPPPEEEVEVEPEADPPPAPPHPSLAGAAAAWSTGGATRGAPAPGSTLAAWSPPQAPLPRLPQVPPLSEAAGQTTDPALPEGTYRQSRREGSFPVDNTLILTTDRYITGILETGINTQLGDTREDGAEGNGASAGIVIQVSRDVFGYHGRTILIPKGSRMVCDTIGPDAVGYSRVGIVCRRLLLAGNRAEVFDLAAVGTDVQGRDGITGEVDTRFWEKYGTAFLLAGLSASARLASAAASDGDDDDESATGAILDAGAAEVSERFGQISATVLEQTVNLNPIVTVPQGTRITIRPSNDVYLRPVPNGG